METSLGTGASTNQWAEFPNTDILRMLHLIFNTICVAMRYEPANAKFFQQEVRIFLECFFFNFVIHEVHQQYQVSHLDRKWDSLRIFI